MNEATLAVFGIASGVVNTIGLIPYVRDILRRKTKPERATWWVWSALGGIAFYAQLQAGATWSLIMTGAGLAAVVLIAVLSLKFGYGSFHRRDTIALIIAGIGIYVAHMINSPLLALLVVIAVDFVGLWLTINKAWAAPYSETLLAWCFSVVSGLLGTLAVGTLELSLLLYPLYIFLGNFLLVSVIIIRRQTMRQPAKVRVRTR